MFAELLPYNMCHSQLLRQPKHNALSGFVLHETEIFAQSFAAAFAVSKFLIVNTGMAAGFLIWLTAV